MYKGQTIAKKLAKKKRWDKRKCQILGSYRVADQRRTQDFFLDVGGGTGCVLFLLLTNSGLSEFLHGHGEIQPQVQHISLVGLLIMHNYYKVQFFFWGEGEGGSCNTLRLRRTVKNSTISISKTNKDIIEKIQRIELRGT